MYDKHLLLSNRHVKESLETDSSHFDVTNRIEIYPGAQYVWACGEQC